MPEFKLIDLTLSDALWLEVLCDLEDLHAPHWLMKVQLKCRPHLKLEKRSFGLDQLKHTN